uniref:Vacuolar protein sorting protein 25 n=1 Tax=Arundo donax TaxID=35708 RepID=A0A0A9AFX0_ARUDO
MAKRSLNLWIGEQGKIFFQGDYMYLLTSAVIKYEIFP